MTIDAHQHFWRPARGDYGWLTPALGAIHRDIEEADLAPFLARHRIDRTILVQAAPSAAETDYLLAVARRAPFVAGIVGWVDFDAPDAAGRIAERAGDSLIRGLRLMIHDIADDAWMLRADLAPAFEAMIANGLRFDALVKPRHLAHLAALVARHPALPVVIDHGGKPDIARWRPGDADFRQWSADLRALAARGCFVKLSGLATEAGPDWSAETLRPYAETMLAHFGPARTMFGSDWPVVEMAGGYDRWHEAASTLAAGWSPDERAKVFGETAARYYGLSTAPGR